MDNKTSVSQWSKIPVVTLFTLLFCAAMLPFRDWLALTPSFVNDAFTSHGENIPTALFSFAAYMFQHSSFERFAGNILFFVLCGTILERAIGHWRFAVFVLATGIGAGFVHVLLNPDLTLGVIGLSGVTMGLIAAVALSGPRLMAVDWLVWLLRTVALLLASTQLFAFFFGPGIQGGDSNSYSLHLGSAICGLSLYFLWLRDRLNSTEGNSRGAKLPF